MTNEERIAEATRGVLEGRALLTKPAVRQALYRLVARIHRSIVKDKVCVLANDTRHLALATIGFAIYATESTCEKGSNDA